jgi:hypothetical protein
MPSGFEIEDWDQQDWHSTPSSCHRPSSPVAAIMDALEAHVTMSTHALESEKVRACLKAILHGSGHLYEALR